MTFVVQEVQLPSNRKAWAWCRIADGGGFDQVGYTLPDGTPVDAPDDPRLGRVLFTVPADTNPEPSETVIATWWLRGRRGEDPIATVRRVLGDPDPDDWGRIGRRLDVRPGWFGRQHVHVTITERTQP